MLVFSVKGCNKFPAHLTGESFVGTLLGAYERGDPVGESVDDDAEEHGENVAQRVAPHELVRRGLSPDGVQEKRRQSERNGAENQHDHSTHQHQNLTRHAVGPGMGGRERCAVKFLILKQIYSSESERNRKPYFPMK